MILFLEDWSRYPEAIVDTKTVNQSFIDLAHVYKKMGIKNHYFHLALHDRTLQGVDPFAPDLDYNTIARIVRECVVNPWYYFREIVSKDLGSSRQYFQASRANIGLYWSYFNNCMFYLLMPRQQGKTYGVMGLVSWILTFLEGHKSGLLTKDSILRDDSIRKLRDIIAETPYYINPLTKKDSNTTENVSVQGRNNFFYTAVAQAAIEAAEKTFRGLSLGPILVIDEVSFIKNLRASLSSASATMTTAGPACRARGIPSTIIYTTTAGKKDTPHGALAYEIFNEFAPYDEHYFDCQNQAELEAIVRKNSNPTSPLLKDTGIYGMSISFSYKQLGKDDAWLAEQATRSHGEDFLRDYLNVWTSGTETSPFNSKQAQMMRMSEREPKAHDASGYVHVKWYYTAHEIDKIMNEKPVVIGIDSSNMVNNDNSCLVFVDATNLEIIGAASVNRVNLYKFSQWLSDFMIKYRKVMIIPENRSSAQGIIDYLIETLPAHGIDPFRRIFNTIVQEKSSDPRKFQLMDSHPNRMNIANQHRNTFGYTTSGYGKYSRDNLYNETLFRAIDISADKLKDNQLINELLSLVIVNGRIDHPKGGHDDMVIAWLLACWFIFNGRETGYYDINRGRFLSEVAFAGEVLDAKTILKKREQDNLKEHITALYNEMSNTDNYFEFAKLEKEIRYLESKLSIENREQMSISGMIDDLKEGKKLTTLRKQPNMVNDIIEGLTDVNTDSLGLNPYNNRDISRFESLLTGNSNSGNLDLDYWLS